MDRIIEENSSSLYMRELERMQRGQGGITLDLHDLPLDEMDSNEN